MGVDTVRKLAKLFSLLPLAVAYPAFAQSTITYTYDAQGRLIGSTVSGGPTNGTTTTIAIDNAGNRTGYRVTGAPTSSGGSNGNGSGAAVTPAPRVIVVPLNGFTIIPIGS